MWIALLLLLIASPAFASEARCDALGANCLCAESFNVSSYTAQSWGAGSYFRPNETNAKKCTHEVTNFPVTTYNDFGAGNDATALSRLPTGHSVSYFAYRPPNQTGQWWIGGTIPSGTTNTRAAMRFYAYHSPTYAFRYDSGDVGCHSKFLQGMPGAWHWENYEGYIHAYDFIGTNWGGAANPLGPGFDCCWGAMGSEYTMTKDNWRGHWFRVEWVLTNRAGGAAPNGVRHRLYMTDVSNGVTKVNGGNTFVASDWWGTATGPDNWTGYNDITSSPAQDQMLVNYYREDHGNCAGFRAASHFLMAAWSTDTGQMIGPATEIESGSPSPPVGVPELTISSLIPVLWVIGLSLAATVCMVKGFGAMARRRRYVAGHQGNGGDDLGQRAWTPPVAPRPTAPSQDSRYGPRPDRSVVGDPRADELVGVGAEVEGSAREAPRTR